MCSRTHSCPPLLPVLTNRASYGLSRLELGGSLSSGLKGCVMKARSLRVHLPTIVLGSMLIIHHVTIAQSGTEPPVVTIVATDHHAAEAETDPGTFTVTRTGNTEASLLVFYELSGTARNGVDYQ